MLDIEKVDHIGIRVSDKSVSIAFYERLGFRTLSDTGFEKGHPVIMQHPSGVVLNLLGPADTSNDVNILMDVDDKYPGITHVSFKVTSIEAAKRFLAENDIPLSGRFSFKDLRAVFIRDPDRNVIELDAYARGEPETRSGSAGSTGYQAHPWSRASRPRRDGCNRTCLPYPIPAMDVRTRCVVPPSRARDRVIVRTGGAAGRTRIRQRPVGKAAEIRLRRGRQ